MTNNEKMSFGGIMEQTIPKIIKEVAKNNPEVVAQRYKDKDGNFLPVTYKELLEKAYDSGAGFLSLGLGREDHIGLISENRAEWFQCDLGIMGIGACDVPRGCDATEKDIQYILSFAECKTVVAENNNQVKKILSVKNGIPTLNRIISFDPIDETTIDACKDSGVEYLSFSELHERGKKYRAENQGIVEAEFEKGQKDDLACIIFTSGTTGEPKGVMLQHKAFLTQIDELVERIPLKPGNNALCILPVWHAFQRLCEYIITSQGATLCYSKPVGPVLLADIQKVNPTAIPAVPRVFEAVYEGIYRKMRKTGGITYALFSFFVGAGSLHSKIDRLMFRKAARYRYDHIVLLWIFLFIPWIILGLIKCLGDVLVFKKIRAMFGTNLMGGVSGGGAYPPAVDNFFWTIGVNIVEGYGLTETAPVISVRPMNKPVFGTVGKPIRGVEVRLVDDFGKIIEKPGVKGSIQVRGGIVMKGYYKKPELTAKVIDKDGWFDTGDLGMKTVTGELVLRGRKKDTIVLRGGENVEPAPIEMKMNESKYISQSVVVGQDEKSLGALVIPSEAEVTQYAQDNNISFTDYRDLLTKEEIIKLIDSEVQANVNAKNGFKTFERISKVALLAKPFEVGVELSAKQEVMRYKIPDLYAKEMKIIFK